MKNPAILAILLICAAAAVYFVGNDRTPLFDRDEPRYAQCSRQMLQSGDWVVPRLYDKIRAAKPPGIYWCQATAMKFLGDNAFAARVPSALAAVLTLIVLAFSVWKEVGPRHALWTSFIFASTLLVIYAAKVCMTDSVLLLWTSVSLMCIYLLWRGGGGWTAVIVLSIAIAFGGLIKGPFILGVLAGTIVLLWVFGALDRWQQRRRGEPSFSIPSQRSSVSAIQILVGLLIIAAIIVPWIILVQHRQSGFLTASARDAMQHAEKGAEGHWGPPGYHLVVIWVTFLPWSLLLPLAIVSGFKNRAQPHIRFALAAALGTWIFVEFVGTKLPHYILPAVPALALLTADTVIRCLNKEYRDLESIPMRMAAVIVTVAMLGIATVPWWWLSFKFHDFPRFSLAAITAAGLGIATAIIWLFLTRRSLAALIAMGSGSLLIAVILFGSYLPNSQPLRLSIRVAAMLRRHNIVDPGQVLMLDYKEPSLAFYQGGTIREAEHSRPVLEHLSEAPPWLVMTRNVWNEATPQQRANLEMVGSPFDGFDYSDALRTVELLVVRNRASAYHVDTSENRR